MGFVDNSYLVKDAWPSQDRNVVAVLVALTSCIVAFLLWRRQQRKPRTLQQPTAEEIVDIRRRRFERLQQQHSEQPSSTQSSNTKIIPLPVKNSPVSSEKKPLPSSPIMSEKLTTYEPTSKLKVPPKAVGDTASSLSTQSIPADIPEETTTNDATTINTANKKKRKTTLSDKSPAEILFVVFKSLVSDQQKTPPSVVQPLLQEVSAIEAKETSWEHLEQDVWPILLKQHLQFDSISQALGWLYRIRDVVEYTSVKDDCKEHLRVCLQGVLRTEITQRVGQMIVKHHESEVAKGNFEENHDDDFEMSVLFDDDYNRASNDAEPSSFTASTTKTLDPLTEFMQLLEPVETILTAQVFEDLQSYHQDLARIFLTRALHDIPTIDPAEKTVSAEKILRSLTCLSNLIVLSSASAKELFNILQQEVDELDKNSNAVEGREMERKSVFRKLMPIAALSIPNLGQESWQSQTSSRRSGMSYFQRAMRKDVPTYPLAVYAQNQTDLNVVVNQIRTIMQQARKRCTTILKRTMKAADSSQKKKRHCLFRWLSRLVQLK